jgi:hypothetical protein
MRRREMKGATMLKWIGLGVAIWSLSLVWPEVNLVLTPPVMAGLALALGAIILAYALGYYYRQNDQAQTERSNKNKQKHSSRPSRPVPPLSMA